jgi:radical SAM superfamily enzyme YgiQ (UPF0313 family)
MKIKFLFVNAINPSQEIETKYPPLGIAYLVSNLRKHFGEENIEFKIVDDNVEHEIRNFKPDIVGISAVSQNYNRAIAYAEIAKRYGLPVICGGVHISMMSSSLTKDMDVGVAGEGEETICDLFELFSRKGTFDKADLIKIKGILYWDNGMIATTDKREPIAPLDELPFPARDLFSIQPNTYMFTSRGCPYRCTFCASSRFWNRVRTFSAEYLVKEIEHLVKAHNVKSIQFYDDIFSVDVRRVRKTIDLLREKGILGKVDFNCSIRANMVNDEIITLLKELGVKSIGMGLESGCSKTLRYLKRDNISIKDNENAIRTIREHEIEVYGSFIIGSPEEDKKDILETLKFIRTHQLTGFDIYVLTPYPGTPVWDYALSKGLVAEKMDWDRLNVNFSDNYDSAIILSEKLTRKELHALFLRFRHEQRKNAIYKLIKTGLRNPSKIPGLLNRKIINRSRN